MTGGVGSSGGRSSGGARFEMRVEDARGEAAHLVWTAVTATHCCELTTDTFVVRGGRIVSPSFAGKVRPRA